MKQIDRTIKFCSLSVAVLFLSACARVDNFADLQSFVDEVKSRPGEPVEPVPEVVAYEAFIYSAASMRSPFEVPLVTESETGLALNQDVEPDFDRPKEYLEGLLFCILCRGKGF